MSNRGKFIVFEGLDGAGTTTQLDLLKTWLCGRGVAAEATREPTSGPIGAIIRLVLEGRAAMDDRTLALAFAADRSDHLFNHLRGVEHLLAQGTWVLCDRYVLSSLAYQAADRVDPEWVATLNRFALRPDATVFVDTSVVECVTRIAQRSTHPERYHDPAKLERIQENYRRFLGRAEFTGPLAVIPGDAPVEDVFEAIRSTLQGVFPELAESKAPAAM